MLNGIGGNTIAEAKENLSYNEACDWAAYIKKRGSINLGRRMEWGFALLAMYLHNSRYKPEKSQEDFLFHEKDNDPISLEKAMSQWQ